MPLSCSSAQTPSSILCAAGRVQQWPTPWRMPASRPGIPWSTAVHFGTSPPESVPGSTSG